MKRKLTKQDLKKTLSELGFKEGQELELPSEKTTDAKTSTTDEGGEGDEGDEENGNHPPKKGGN